MKWLVRVLAASLTIDIVACIAIYVAFKVSPFPAVMLIRRQFDADSAKMSVALARHVPPGVLSELNVRYDAGDPNGYFDVFFPRSAQRRNESLTTILWIHGGAWIAGTKDQIASYARILSSRGFTVVSVDYTVAPEARYPTPIGQANLALEYLAGHSGRFHVDPARFVLAGDSAGAHIAAQLANAISVPSYAGALGIRPAIPRDQLAGVILYCGAYDVTRLDLNGRYGGFLRTALWAYSGEKDFQESPTFATASVVKYVTASFPPTFISVGNADPLAAQSYDLAATLRRRGVRVDAVFFPEDYRPPLGHEYQFDLDTKAGRTALDRSAAFLGSLR